MATRRGLVKKTPLEQYGNPRSGGLIAIKLREGDEVVDVVVTQPGDEIVLATARGMAIRFSEADVRPMGRNTSGVKGIKLASGDHVVGMVIADPEATLLTACLHGYGKRTPFGPSTAGETQEPAPSDDEDAESLEPVAVADSAPDEDDAGTDDEDLNSSRSYRTQRRGGKGLRDIKTTPRNGPVIGIVSVRDDDEVMMISARGKIQRIAASEVSVIGRNTQGVRIMSLDENDTLAAVVRVPREEQEAIPDAAEMAAPADGDA
jgi:DNA gyrase subunit A